MTEIFFESSEPTFDELDPDYFFGRFPAGIYEWKGKTIEGIYSLEKGTLRICAPNRSVDGSKRPTKIATGGESDLLVLTFERVKKE